METNMSYSMYPENTQASAPPYDTMIFGQQQINATMLREQRLKELCGIYEINPYFAERIKALEGYEIVVVADDSGSMNSILCSNNPYGKAQTRWDELRITIGIVVDIAATLDHNGIDVYFLNRPALKNITHSAQLEAEFKRKPSGGTGIVPILRSIFSVKCDAPRLIILATDGQPTDAYNNSNIPEFKSVLQYERSHNDYMTILACTDDDDVMDYLNNWDKELPRLDVVDDYHSERKEIIAVQGTSFPFSFGDYVVKALMGSVDPWFDKLDEVKANLGAPAENKPHSYIDVKNDPILAAELGTTNNTTKLQSYSNSGRNTNSTFPTPFNNKRKKSKRCSIC
jgi:hypothetical protein